MEPSQVESIDGAENLRRDARMLERALPACRVAVIDRACLSVGVFPRDSAGPVRRAEAAGIPVVHRSTGGSAVLVGRGDIAWSIVLPREDRRVGRDYVHAYRRFGHGVVAGLAPWIPDVAWAPGPALLPELCYLSGRGEVLGARDRIVGGAAQHRTGGALLHHGLIGFELDRSILARLFDLPPGADRRLGGLVDLGVTARPETLAEAVRQGLAREIEGNAAP